ncbi:hypothetical protein CC86DRAFT_374952 [Ophiobolus disseminans]|uniref:Uncharacterized protein n=1 Tax=Ophiobolus disseminans TaxID=1469910 RepID=A0A6A6ZG43_9PLEO|nr:hypothetical protein CC86DRAFT_374952 [Ophiobolus disseminans]
MDEDEYDSDIAAAMGFSSFGGTKKRKHSRTASPKPAEADASGANSTKLGVRTKVAPKSVQKPAQALSDSQPELSASETVSFGGPRISKAELNALRFGVKNDDGDTAYFLPNFIGDPWEGMQSGA